MSDQTWLDWHLTGPQEVEPGIIRIPLSLHMDGLKAVNVYAVSDGCDLTMIDAGIALESAEAELVAGLATIGAGLGDITRFVVTHFHRDHYPMAERVRRRLGTEVLCGVGERAGFEDLLARDPGREIPQYAVLQACGAPPDLLAETKYLGLPVDKSLWTPPDRWLDDQEIVAVGARRLIARHTPGHTQGHFVYHDLERTLMFTGDHVLPHITPSIGFEQIIAPSPLRSYLASLELMRAAPDARLLPGHGPVGPSVHDRVDELLRHHARRLEATLQALDRGASTAYEVAGFLTWTSADRHLDELDTFNTMLAVLETRWHLEVLLEQGHVLVNDSDGLRHFTR